MKKLLQLTLFVCAMWFFGTNILIAQTFTLGPVDNYGFLTGPDGTTWTYTAEFTLADGHPNGAKISIYDDKFNLVGNLDETFELDSTDLWINTLELNPIITRKFFNSDNNIELMLFIHVATNDYKGRLLNQVYSLSEEGSNYVCTVAGNQVLAKNISTTANDNYTMVFFRQTYQGDTLYYNYDVYGKADYGTSSPVLKHTFEIPYQNIAALNDPMPIFMIPAGPYQLNYVVAQYEKPFFVAGTSLNEDQVVNENNSFVLTTYDFKFNVVSETKIPMVKNPDPSFLYTFYYLGGLTGQNDIILDYNGTGKPAYIITHDNYETASDGSVCSYYLYDHQGNMISTIVENSLGNIYMSDVPGQEKQIGFLKYENDIEFIQFVDIPSCKTISRISLHNNGATLSGNWDRVPYEDSYRYVVSLLQGENAADKTIHQRIAWFNSNGKLDHYDDLNLGLNVEYAQVYIYAPVLNPRMFNTDNAYEYLALLKRTQKNTSAKEEVLVICNNQGKTIFELGTDLAKGGSLSMIDVNNMNSNPTLLCVFTDGDRFTLNHYSLPLYKTEMKGEGTIENPYQITCPSDFIQIDDNPSAHYKVMNDIDFEMVAFKGLKKTFTGSLDGGNFAFKNLYLDGSGLFSHIVDSVKIKDLILNNVVMVLGTSDKSVGLLGNIISGGITDEGVELHATISNIQIVRPAIYGKDYKGVCGGLFGEAALYTDISQSFVLGADFYLPQAESVGGLVGKTETSSNIQAGAFSGKIDGGKNVGGMVGYIGTGGPIVNCHTDADLSGLEAVGGIAGYSSRTTIANCYVEGALTLNESTKGGGVGGILGRMEEDASGSSKAILVQNCLVGVTEIVAPERTGVAAHRVIGFTSVDVTEYDWDNVDWSKPQEEWPTIYPYKADLGFKYNYVISELAAIDQSIALEDNTTEGATLAVDQLTDEWFATHNFVLGDSISAPWVYTTEDGLSLWFVPAELPNSTDNVVVGGSVVLDNGIVSTNIDGTISVYNLNGMLLLQGKKEVNVSSLSAGIYIININGGDKTLSTKLLIP